MGTPQFWLLYVMAIMSVFQGYYTINVYKAYGYTQPALNDDIYLTKVGSASAFMGALRWIWSASMDLESATFKKVYGTLLAMQILLGASIEYVAGSQLLFAIWVCFIIFTEGGQFVIIPTAVRQLYGPAAGPIYGVIFTFTGLSNLMVMVIVQSEFGKTYDNAFLLSAFLSSLALICLMLGFTEEPLYKQRVYLDSSLKCPDNK